MSGQRQRGEVSWRTGGRWGRGASGPAASTGVCAARVGVLWAKSCRWGRRGDGGGRRPPPTLKQVLGGGWWPPAEGAVAEPWGWGTVGVAPRRELSRSLMRALPVLGTVAQAPRGCCGAHP